MEVVAVSEATVTRGYSIPSHLPGRLAISLWDVSWCVRLQPGEPFDDLDRAFSEAVERGFNAVRICAMPYLLFGPDGRRPGALRFNNMGGGFGRRTRWYDTRGDLVVDGHAQLLHLFRTARKHHCYIIISSWEYQQTCAFLAAPELYYELRSIPPRERFRALARAMGRLIQFLKEHNLADRIAYAELHNEVDGSRLLEVSDSAGTSMFPEMAGGGEDPCAAVKPYVEEAVGLLRQQHPDVLISASYCGPTIYRLRHLAGNLQVAHFHLYAFGVLGELFRAAGLEPPTNPFPNEITRTLLRPDAPPFETWMPRSGEEWRLDATLVDRRLFYAFDWADPEKWDLWLYERYGEHRISMRQTIAERLAAMADWAAQCGIPPVIGEGYVGYTPLYGGFEEGPVGKDIAEFAIETALRHDFWGLTPCSNAAPHHPFWQDSAWLQRMNHRILEVFERVPDSRPQ
jgi:hypothetical protein